MRKPLAIALALVAALFAAGLASAQDPLAEELERIRQDAPLDVGRARSIFNSVDQVFVPDISVIIDTVFHANDTGENIGHVLEEMEGFGHAHGDHDHHHGEIERGFNLRELELVISADVDPYFRAWTTLAFSEHGVEVEEAVVQTRSLPYGLQLQAGKFFSGFGRINEQHPHDWDFVDRPLVSELLFGDHGINEVGVQLTWIAPTPFYMLFGVEALQGRNENAFNHIGGDYLPEHAGPRLGIGWMKFAPNLPDPHALQLGMSFGLGEHQEAHALHTKDLPVGAGKRDHYLRGHSTFLGYDAVYKYTDPRPYGQGDFTAQAEYMFRRKDLELRRHYGSPQFEGNDREEKQDGFYAQAVYGFAPRWRGGLRWDQVGMTNRVLRPNDRVSRYSSSHRLAAMVDFTPTEYSRLRLQAARGEYRTEDHGRESALELNLQFILSIGVHGAHKF